MTVDGHGGTRGPGIGAVAFVPAAVTVAVTVGLLWTTGNVSALVTHGRRPRAKLEDIGAVAVRLVRHPSDPAAAWPAGDRELIPGPAGFYATLLVMVTLTIALLVVGWRIHTRLQDRLPGIGDYGASWASRHDLRDLVIRTGSDLTGRIVLGRTRWRQTIASPLRHSLLLFGPTLSVRP